MWTRQDEQVTRESVCEYGIKGGCDTRGGNTVTIDHYDAIGLAESESLELCDYHALRVWRERRTGERNITINGPAAIKATRERLAAMGRS